jgi:hypothetical protein
MWKLFFKGKIEIIKKSSQKFVSFLYISIDNYKNKIDRSQGSSAHGSMAGTCIDDKEGIVILITKFSPDNMNIPHIVN